MYRMMLAAILITIACKTVPFNPQSFNGDLIAIGEGGGFAGIETKYYFTPEGQVYQQTGRDTTLVKLAKIDRKLMRQVHSTVGELGLHDYTYSNPGNVYKFIALRIDGKENRIVWSGPSDGVNRACPAIYNLLKQSLKE